MKLETIKENILHLYLTTGKVTILMYPDKAPKHVERLKELVRAGYYTDKTFHRVIDKFMAQCGSLNGDGNGGTGVLIPAEFNNVKHGRGTVSMARANHPDSADCQFFICFNDANFLDGQYTVWGQVIHGMEYVDAIRRGDSGQNGLVLGEKSKIIKAVMAADEVKDTSSNDLTLTTDDGGNITVAIVPTDIKK